MIFKLIKTGSLENCLLVSSKTTNILIDIGALQKSDLEKYISLDKIDGCLITHNHFDHIAGIKSIPESKQYSLEKVLANPGHNIISFHEEFCIGDIRIHPFPVFHDASNTCGYIVYADGEKLVYITDCAYLPIFKELYNPKYLLVECCYDKDMLIESPIYTEETKRRIMTTGHLENREGAAIAKELIGNDTVLVWGIHPTVANKKEKTMEALKSVINNKNIEINATDQVLKDVLEGGTNGI